MNGSFLQNYLNKVYFLSEWRLRGSNTCLTWLPHISLKNAAGPEQQLQQVIHKSQSFTFGVGRATVSKIIGETREGIWAALKDVYINVANHIAIEFGSSRWQAC